MRNKKTTLMYKECNIILEERGVINSGLCSMCNFVQNMNGNTQIDITDKEI